MEQPDPPLGALHGPLPRRARDSYQQKARPLPSPGPTPTPDPRRRPLSPNLETTPVLTSQTFDPKAPYATRCTQTRTEKDTLHLPAPRLVHLYKFIARDAVTQQVKKLLARGQKNCSSSPGIFNCSRYPRAGHTGLSPGSQAHSPRREPTKQVKIKGTYRTVLIPLGLLLREG